MMDCREAAPWLAGSPRRTNWYCDHRRSGPDALISRTESDSTPTSEQNAVGISQSRRETNPEDRRPSRCRRRRSRYAVCAPVEPS